MGNKGIGLIVAIFIVVLLASLGVVGVAMLSTDIEISVESLLSARALYIAEAGIQDVLYRLKDDPDFRDTPTSPTTGSIASGSYSVAIVKSGDTYTLTSTGSITDVGGASIIRKVEQTAVVVSGALERAIHADGAHVKFDDSTGTVNGNISCFNSVMNEDDMAINGTITEGDDQDKINAALVLTTYYDEADDAGQVAANKTFSSATYTGVWYVTNKATIGDNARIEGTIISEKSIEFNGKASGVLIDPELHAPGENYPALYAGTNITSTDTGKPSQRVGLQNSSINGLVMAGNNITFNYLDNMSGTGNFGGDTYDLGFNGTIISGSNIELEDGDDFVITYNEDIYDPVTPGFTFSGGDVTITTQDWQEVE